MADHLMMLRCNVQKDLAALTIDYFPDHGFFRNHGSSDKNEMGAELAGHSFTKVACTLTGDVTKVTSTLRAPLARYHCVNNLILIA